MEKIYSLEEFVQYYNKYKKTPNQMNKPKNLLNEKQLNSLYIKYRKKQEKKNELYRKITQEDYEADPLWEEIKRKVFKRDSYHCQLQCELSDSELFTLKLDAPSDLIRILDPCHIFGKGAFPHMKYDINNVVTMNRYSHSCIDQCRNPITGEQITDGEKELWWQRIIGVKNYFILKNKAYKRKF